MAIYDAFLVHHTAFDELQNGHPGSRTDLASAARSFYETLEHYLLASTGEGRIVRQWRERWEERFADCEAGRDTWPSFLTKPEGAELR